ncbi:putative ataxin-7 isoform X1 [Sciurus carolinensis]|uniref:Ataxin-7 isoform X1 n=1 Tax=Sciurus carolinensis TaxID=30640 RepID=A0AA41T5M4_SCICA|nr:putative ataxin-7 isoform X1 [Sciurus carolinensis]
MEWPLVGGRLGRRLAGGGHRCSSRAKGTPLTPKNSTGRNNLDTFEDKLHLHSEL